VKLYKISINGISYDREGNTKEYKDDGPSQLELYQEGLMKNQEDEEEE
jgi:hypothetical protein